MPSFSVCGSRGDIGVGDSVLERCINTLIHSNFITWLSTCRFAVAVVRMRVGRVFDWHHVSPEDVCWNGLHLW